MYHSFLFVLVPANEFRTLRFPDSDAVELYLWHLIISLVDFIRTDLFSPHPVSSQKHTHQPKNYTVKFYRRFFLLSAQIPTFRLDKQLLRNTCHLFRNSCFWLTQSRQVTRGYRAWNTKDKVTVWMCCFSFFAQLVMESRAFRLGKFSTTDSHTSPGGWLILY